MQATQQIANQTYWLGGNDRRLQRFENIHPLPKGVSYNSYAILDEKTALLDSVDYAVAAEFLEKLDTLLAGRPLDYLILNHIEPDHSASIQLLCQRYPNLQLVGNQKTAQMLGQFYNFKTPPQFLTVQEGDELDLGQNKLTFYFAPMVHWPEVMFTYNTTQNILFSADAFGAFGALPGNIFSDEMDFEHDFLDEARRYYTNIVGKYGPQVQAALKKLSGAPLAMVCPLHGPIWRKNINYYLDKYNHWSTYTPEENGVVIAYGSMYGNTKHVAELIANRLSLQGVRNIHVYDVSKTHVSYIIADIFKYSHLVLAAPTYNMNVYPPMQALLHDMQILNLQNRKVAIASNGSWAPNCHTLMQKMLLEMKSMEILAEPFVVRSSFKEENAPQLAELINTIAQSVKNANQ